MSAKPTFKEIIHAALKTPEDVDYGVKDLVHSLPVGEYKQSYAIKSLQEQLHSGPRSVVMSFGGLFAFDLAIATRPPPAGVLLCDINSDQAIFWNSFLPLVEECETAAELRTRFAALPNQMGPVNFRSKYDINQINNIDEQCRNLEWIYDENKYQKVRNLILEGKVANITLDCMDCERYGAIRKTLMENNLSVGVMYLSNISDFIKSNTHDYYSRVMKENAERIFWQNQLSLCDENTLLLHTAFSLGRNDIKLQKPQDITKIFRQ